MLKKKVLPKDVYGSWIMLLQGTRDELNGYLWRQLKHEPDASREQIGPAARAHTTEYTPSGRVPIYYIAVVQGKSRDRFDLLAALGHECLHVVLSVLEFRGVKITTDNDEPVTYYFEWLFRLCAREVW